LRHANHRRTSASHHHLDHNDHDDADDHNYDIHNYDIHNYNYDHHDQHDDNHHPVDDHIVDYVALVIYYHDPAHDDSLDPITFDDHGSDRGPVNDSVGGRPYHDDLPDHRAATHNFVDNVNNYVDERPQANDYNIVNNSAVAEDVVDHRALDDDVFAWIAVHDNVVDLDDDLDHRATSTSSPADPPGLPPTWPAGHHRYSFRSRFPPRRSRHADVVTVDRLCGDED
jgi:hypothetical protein